MKISLFITIALLVTIPQIITATNVPADFDCAMRKAAYQYGQSLLPRHNTFKSLWYALNLNNETGDECYTPLKSMKKENIDIEGKSDASITDENAIFVHPENGLDKNMGTSTSPLASIQKAADLAASTDGKKYVALYAGIYYLTETIMLTPKHNGLTFTSVNGAVTVSGGIKIASDSLQWKPHDTTNGKNIWVANIGIMKEEVKGLQIGGKRLTRARYPNIPGGLEVSCGYGCMISGGDAAWTPPKPLSELPPIQYYTDNIPAHTRNNTAQDWFQHYMIGIDGRCSVYDPPVSYWCSEHPSGGGAFAFLTPSGVKIDQKTLPNSPYADPSDATFFVWRPARWANWMFKVGNYDNATNNFTFGYGGFQGARGSPGGGDFFVENVFEELDYPSEYFYNKKTGMLYLYHNATSGTPPPVDDVVIPNLQILVNVTGTQWNPVKGIEHKGITYTATSETYMYPHGVPSGGDWALDRIGAVFLQGTEKVVFDGCNFTRLDGNGVFISGYNRNATVMNSDFSFMGGNAIASWGITNETEGENHPQAGVDGTDGNHPRYNQIFGNTAREVGLYEKQSSFYVQAKTAQSVIKGNVFFNGPRAGINANDGFGGGDEIAHNLVFSTCRESGDHGPFNSWDRQPYLTDVRTGEPSMFMAWREIHHNFFIDNYSPQENVDNDDGSGYYYTHDNFMVYGGQGMKNDFGGHDNHHFENIYAFIGQALGDGAVQIAGHEDAFYSNVVIQTGDNIGSLQCDAPGKSIVHDNQYFTPSGSITECSKSLSDWQKEDSTNDPNSTVAKWPKTEWIIAEARKKLDF